MNTMVSFALLVVIVILAIGIVSAIIIPLVNNMIVSSEIQGAESEIKSIDNVIRNVIREGAGVARAFSFSGPYKIDVFPEEDAIQFRRDIDINLFEYFSRSIAKNMAYIAGADVSCYEQDADSNGTTDLVLENTYVKFAFQKVPKASPLSSIDTKNNVVLMQEKTYNTIIYPSNSSVVINDNVTTSFGTGYSEILRSGLNVPECTVHFYINSGEGTDYDIYYKLYAGADFLVIDVRNI